MWIRERTTANGNMAARTRSDAPEEAHLRWWVERLAVPRHLFANSRNNAWVRAELATAFEHYGFDVELQGKYKNVVALPRSSNDGRPVTFIAAHYDTVVDCPGADDNASGLAVMLECARILAQLDLPSPVGLIAFNAEEEGLLGSRDFVANGLPELRVPLRLVHVLEMVGFRSRAPLGTPRLPLPWVPASFEVPDFIGLLAKGPSNAVVDGATRSLASPGLRLVTAKTWGPLHRLIPDLTRSDHFPFWNAGIPAALWTDTGNFRNPHYHRATDTPETLDYAFMREVAELLCSVVSEGRAGGRWR